MAFTPHQLVSQLKVAVAAGQSLRAPQNEGLGRIPNPGKDPLGFVLQIAGLLFGADFLETRLNKLLRTLAGTPDQPGELETLLKGSLYQACVAGLGDEAIPADFATTGYQLPVRLLDLFDLFRVEPASPTGQLVHTKVEKALIENVLRRPGISQRLPDLPYLSFTADTAGEVVLVKFDAAAGPSPAPARLVDLFAEIIYAPTFRLLDPGRLALDVLDVALGVSAAKRTARSEIRQQLVAGLATAFTAEVVSEDVLQFSAPALVAAEQRAADARQGYQLTLGCGPEYRPVPAEAITVPSQPGGNEPNLELAYRTVSVQYLKEGEAPSTSGPVRDAFSGQLLRAMVLVILRNTVLAPRVWSLLLLSRIFRVGYPQTRYNRFISASLNEVEFHELLQPTRPLLETITKTASRVAVDFLTDQLLALVKKQVAPLLKRIAGEQLQGHERTLTSLNPFS